MIDREPIFDNGARVGSVVRLPAPPQRQRAKVAPASAPDADEQLHFAGAVGHSTQLRESVEKAARLAKSRVSVLLLTRGARVHPTACGGAGEGCVNL